MQMTVRSNNAMRMMMYLALSERPIAPVGDIARACNMSETHLGKIANALAANGFIETIRGRGGGVRLALPAEEINVGSVVRCTELAACLVECLDEPTNTCPLIDACKFRGVVKEAFAAFLKVFDRYTLADLVEDADDLAIAMGLMSVGAGRARGSGLQMTG